MKYNEENYNRLYVSKMYEWKNDEWITDRNGNMILKEELAETESI
jgi:hypothetical protein